MNLFAKIGREFRLFQDILLVKKWTGDISPDSENLVADDYERAADQFAGNVAFRFEGQSTTY
ncbi:MAG: hypothetical protein B7Z22_12270, partial [Hyphomonas sp. 32-62-5]